MKKLTIIIILIVVICGIGFGLFKLNKALEKNNASQNNSNKYQTEQQKQEQQLKQNQISLSNLSNTQILNLANASMSNIDYTFKSVFSKEVVGSQLNVVLLGVRESNGQYLTKRINASFEENNGHIMLVPGSMQGTNITAQSQVNYNGPVNIDSKEQAVLRVLNYYNSRGYNVNATDWAMDVFPNQTIGNYTGYLVHVYETFNGNPESVAWFLVSDAGNLYDAGQSGNGPITAL
ncbi:hypothetical protein [Clostridium mediterraneense]|uniref:hypothetical protein n=1 Tax=Clostridium mediterraneense TaxID=1805472 RepID=UPI00082F22AD|nr:hypothetical protein [Clostridium mediterraneense]